MRRFRAVADGPTLIDNRISAHETWRRFSLSQVWTYVLGADTLGRSLLARLVVGAPNTIGIAFFAVLCSVVIAHARLDCRLFARRRRLR